MNGLFFLSKIQSFKNPFRYDVGLIFYKWLQIQFIAWKWRSLQIKDLVLYFLGQVILIMTFLYDLKSKVIMTITRLSRLHWI